MTRHTPRQLFRKQHKEAVAALAVALSEPWMQQAISATLAEMAHFNRTDAIPGANEFIGALHSLGDEDKPLKTPPDPSLPSYGM